MSQVASSGTTYALADGLGSVRLLTDGSGNQVGTQTYDAYGSSRSQSGAQLPFGFSGQQTDPESGLQYLRAREYDPSTGRFLSQDPLSASPGWGNGYPYAGDSPAESVDPSGEDTGGRCWSVSVAAFGKMIQYQVCAVGASNGDVGVEASGGIFGATGAGVSTCVGAQASNGNSLNDLVGPFWDVGGSGALGDAGGGADLFGGQGSQGQPIQGISIQGCAGASAEGHAGVTQTAVAGVNIPRTAHDLCRVLSFGKLCNSGGGKPAPRAPSPQPAKPGVPPMPLPPFPSC